MASNWEEGLIPRETHHRPSQRMRGIGPPSNLIFQGASIQINKLKADFQFETGGRHKCKTLGHGSGARDHGWSSHHYDNPEISCYSHF